MIKRSLLNFLKQGVSPASLAWAVTAGVVIAYVPIFGVATLICLAAIWVFKLNPAAVLLVNQVAYPLQFVFYIPLLRTGEWLFGATPIPFSLSEIFDMAKENFWNVLSLLWQSTLYAVVVWILISIPLAFLLQYILRLVFSAVKPSQTS